MLLNLSEDLRLAAPPDEVWKCCAIRRASRAVAGSGKRKALDERGGEAYAARVSEKIGPFKVTMNLEVRVTEGGWNRRC